MNLNLIARIQVGHLWKERSLVDLDIVGFRPQTACPKKQKQE